MPLKCRAWAAPTLKNLEKQNVAIDLQQIWQILEQVHDPEIPVLSVVDLGIVREVTAAESGAVEIKITPTYSGCPAMDVIRMQIRLQLLEHGFKDLNITQVLSPPWTTDWISEQTKEKLRAYGIAPPHACMPVCDIRGFAEEEAICCPRCHSYDTRRISQFGSTPCKALYQCNQCQEPFDYFKSH